jgi:hypothetical protein
MSQTGLLVSLYETMGHQVSDNWQLTIVNCQLSLNLTL